MSKKNIIDNAEEAISLDLETGGLNPFKDGIRSIAFYINDDIYLNILLKPVKNLRYDNISEQITGITLEKMEDEGIPESEAFEIVKNFLKEYASADSKPILVGQNLNFDLMFMEAMFNRNSLFVNFNELVHHHYLDSMHFKLLLKCIGGYKGPIKLEESYEYITGKKHEAHDALADAKAAKEEIIFLRNKAKKEKWGKEINL